MKRSITIKALLGGVLGLFLLCLFLWIFFPRAFRYEVVVMLCGSGAVLTLLVMNRLSVYRKKLQLAMKHILGNNFQTGISIEGTDELAQLAREFNRIVDRMNEYDRLRSKKIFIVNRLVKSLIREISDCVMIFDLGCGRISLNQATQELFGVSQDELTIDSVVRLEANSALREMFEAITTGKANSLSGLFEWHLPILRAQARVNVNMFAIKDTDETIHSVVCMLAKQ